MDRVSLICIKVKGKLRVRITSPGYKPECNCQFPRNLRVDGRKFTVPINNIKLTKISNTYYYRVSANDIKIEDGVANIEEYMKNIKIYGEGEDICCIICMDSNKDTVFGPCGHFNCCNECASNILSSTRKCPMCRTNIDCIINYKDLK